MKIALLASSTKSASCGPRLFLKYAEAMAERGHTVTVIFPGPLTSSLATPDSRVRLCFCPKWLAMGPLKGGFGIGELIHKTVQLVGHSFDCVHVCPGHRPSYLLSAVLARLIRGSTIVDEWWEWFGKGGCADLRKGFFGRCVGAYDSVMEVRSKRSYDGVIAITSSLAKRCVNGTEVVVLNGGSDVGSLVSYDKLEARRELGLSDHLAIVGMSGLAMNDHHDNVPCFKAVASLSQRLPGLRLLVTGDSEYIGKSVSPLLPREVLINVGWVDYRKYNLYLSACDAFVLPFPDTCRNRARWPNKIGDYVALERPIITNSTGDVAAFFHKYRIGYLCPHTQQGYAEAIVKIVTNACDSWESHEAAASLSFESRVDKILQFYDMLKEKRLRPEEQDQC
jgi:glycosyltransferase involved in cell wall biosynthesis